jgi:3-hydroxyisobutyryl-CoA hydrolase
MLRNSRRFLSDAAKDAAPAVLFSNLACKVKTVTLNREKALNSLNLEMIELMLPHYEAWHKVPSNEMVVILKGAGPKAFCAGGDIVSLYKDEPKGMRKKFFYREYQLNYAIMSLHHPHVSLWDGIVMGGGVGVSVHGSHRVATEKAVFAMPETGIGPFPDVGGTWFLPRLNKHRGLGLYLALTGQRLKGADLYHAGIATHYIESQHLGYLEALLNEVGHGKEVTPLLNTKAVPEKPPKFSLESQLESIAKYFGSAETSVESIIDHLKTATGAEAEWANKQLDTLSKMSPTSLKVTHELFKRGGKLRSAIEMFKLEYNTTQHIMHETKDFFTGVNALLIEKHNKPVWEPKTLEEVTEAAVKAHFNPAQVEWHPHHPYPETSKL